MRFWRRKTEEATEPSATDNLQDRDKAADIDVKKSTVKKEQAQIKIDQQRVMIEKCQELRAIITDFTVDPEKTLIGSDPAFMSAVSDSTKALAEKKLVEIIKKF